MTSLELRRDLVILACAISAGIHGALTPEHLAERTGAGAGFLAGTLLLVASAVALTSRPASLPLLAAAASVLAGLLASYALATTTGLPILHPEPEAVEGIGLTTKAIEAAGLVAALTLLRRPWVAVYPEPKGT